MVCCSVANTKFGAFDAAGFRSSGNLSDYENKPGRIRQGHNVFYLVLHTGFNPLYTAINFCPWCGTNLRNNAEEFDGTVDLSLQYDPESE